MTSELVIVFYCQQSQQDASYQVHTLSISFPTQTGPSYQDFPQLTQILCNSVSPAHILIYRVQFTSRKTGRVCQLFEGKGSSLSHLFGIGQYLPHVLPDAVVDSLKDRKVEVFFGVDRQIASKNNISPLLQGQCPSFTALADQQKILNVHVFHSLLFYLRMLFLPQDDEILARLLLQNIVNYQFEAVRPQFGSLHWLRLLCGDKVCLELSKQVHRSLLNNYVNNLTSLPACSLEKTYAGISGSGCE